MNRTIVILVEFVIAVAALAVMLFYVMGAVS